MKKVTWFVDKKEITRECKERSEEEITIIKSWYEKDLKPATPLSSAVKDEHIRQFKIPKKNGMRTITTLTSDFFKEKQQHYLNVLNTIKPYRFAFAYAKKRSIQQVAYRHADFLVLMKFDLKGFFDRISTNDVYAGCLMHGLLPERAREIAENCTYNNQLPQGFATSAPLSNICFSHVDKHIKKSLETAFDQYFKQLCPASENIPVKVRYSRYADDMIVSVHIDHKRLTEEVMMSDANDLTQIHDILTKTSKKDLTELMTETFTETLKTYAGHHRLNKKKSRIFIAPQPAHLLGHVLQPTFKTHVAIAELTKTITTNSYAALNQYFKFRRGIKPMEGQQKMLAMLAMPNLLKTDLAHKKSHVTVSRKKRRILRAMEHQAALGSKKNTQVAIKGLKVFCLATKPAFVPYSANHYSR